MKKILVPFDFSALSMSALRFVIDLAEAAHGQVTALHVINMTPVYLESLDPNGYPAGSASILLELSREATEHFARVKGELKTSIEPGFRVEQGLLHQIVIKTIHETEADLVVMGTNGSNGIAEVMMVRIPKKSSGLRRYLLFPSIGGKESARSAISFSRRLSIWISTVLYGRSGHCNHFLAHTFTCFT